LDDIETYLAGEMGEQFISLRDTCAERLGHDRSSKALKNAEVMSPFLCEIFTQGYLLRMFREIGNNIATVTSH
jgi:hypothetical protein